MAIKWVSNKIDASATIYESNITLNTASSSYFKSSSRALIGYDEDSNSIVIKPLSDEEESSIQKDAIHQIVLKSTYGRISGTNIVKNLCQFVPLDFKDKASHKFKCSWDDEKKMLLINLSTEI